MCCNLVYIDQNAIFKWNKANVILNYFNIYPLNHIFEKREAQIQNNIHLNSISDTNPGLIQTIINIFLQLKLYCF